MAMLASKAPYSASSLGPSSAGQGPSSAQYPSSSYRSQAAHTSTSNGSFASPTESEFSGIHETPETVKAWGEEEVCDWLRSINCGQYADLFRMNHINGENLMDMDQTTLKEMGIKKIGDRVRIGSQAKVFRNREYRKSSKRNMNRDSLAALDSKPLMTPPSSASPRPLQPLRSTTPASLGRSEKRMSRALTSSDLNYANLSSYTKPTSRPTSPLVEEQLKPPRATGQRQAYSPMENIMRDLSKSYFGNNSASSTVIPPPTTTSPQAARFQEGARGVPAPLDTPKTARFTHVKASSSMDANVTNSSALPTDKALIRVIWETGRSSVVNIEGCKTADDIVIKTLKKGNFNEAHYKSYCFYVLDGLEADPQFCRRLMDNELVRVCADRPRTERGRLMLRKLHLGEPDGEQLKTAASIAAQQPLPSALPSNPRSAAKIEKITGESLAAVSYPQSPGAVERQRNWSNAAQDLERSDTSASSASSRARKLKDFYGARPPSELITADLASYFPDFQKEEIEKTVRMSIRRSRRISKAASRLSTASNFSFSAGRDAPPIPAIGDNWLSGIGARPPRPLSVLNLRSGGSFRDSIASSFLDPLAEEESPVEPHRDSYASFGENGSGGSANGDNSTVAITDPEGNTTMKSYFDDTGSASPAATDAGGSLNSRLSQVIAEDGEEPDEELMDYLEKDSWDHIKYMKGEMIGQGSFGSVYLSLNPMTGELMALKQVEMPSSSGSQLDAKKNNMVEALKHEISLLRALKHPHIVRYLGSNSDENHLNIFLEYVPGGSVATMLVNYGPLPEPLIRNFVRQIVVGLSYLHSKDIIHRDIKGANILVDNKGSVKISDFGISKKVEASSLLKAPGPGGAGGRARNPHNQANARVSLQGSVFWMAPEVVKQTAYTRKADIWSLGCLIVEMFTGSHPHPNCTQLQAIFKIGGSGDACPTIPDDASEDAKAFLRSAFEIDHEKRPEAEELLRNPFCAVKT